MNIGIHDISINLPKLKEIRKQHGFTLAEISEQLDYDSPNGYWKIEKGLSKITAEQLKFLSLLYKENIEIFFTIKNAKMENN